MLYCTILNEMNEDELRNYAAVLNDQQEKIRGINNVTGSMLDSCLRMLSDMRFIQSMQIDLKHTEERLFRIEEELQRKYQSVMPVPQCACEPAETEECE